jgi:hypothetical protein
MMHLYRHLHPGLGGQRDLAIDPRRLAAFIALRRLPHADQRVAPAPPVAASVGSLSARAPGVYAPIFYRIGTDLVARAKKLVAQERNQLVDRYLAWGDQYRHRSSN